MFAGGYLILAIRFMDVGIFENCQVKIVCNCSIVESMVRDG